MLNRRNLLQTLAASGLAVATSALATPGDAPRKLPNILWLVSEDHSPMLGAYGDEVARTPVLDALARKGVLYRHAYASAPVCAPSRFGILTGCYPETCSPAQHMRAVAHLPADLKTYPELLRAAGYYCSNNEKTDYNCDVVPEKIWDESSAQAHWRKRPAGQPFMAVFNHMTTHESRLFGPQPVPGPVSPEQVQIPPYLPDTPAIRRDLANYYNLIARMDQEVGARLAELEQDGLAEDTIVFFYSDHGGVLPRSKRYCYEEGLRAALIAYFPPKWQHLCPVAMGSEVTQPVSLVDLTPTVLSIAGMPKPGHMQGEAFLGQHPGKPARYAFGMRNRMDERYDFIRSAGDGRYRYIRNYMPHRPWGVHLSFEWIAKGYQSWEEAWLAGTLTPEQSRFFGRKPFEEFYDLQADPHQLVNRVGDAALAGTVQRFREALDAHMLAIRDNGFIPEGEAPEGYAATREDRDYPLAPIMRAASVAAQGRVQALPQLRTWLQDPNAVLRYWGATGLVILGKDAAPASAALARAATLDDSAAVRIAAAEALCKIGGVEVGLPVLKEAIAAGQPLPRRLMALNAFEALGDAGRPALPAIKAIVDDPNDYVVRAARYQVAVLEGRYRPGLPTGRPRQAGGG